MRRALLALICLLHSITILDADGTFFSSGGNRDDYTPPDLSSLEQFRVPTSGGAQGGLDPRTARVSLRIVGGYEAVPGMFPWLANENRECGATLISREWILTAGHCRMRVGEKITFNRWNILDPSEPTAETRTIVEAITHEGYDYESSEERDDIALVRLDRPADHTAPARLPTDEEAEMFEKPNQLLTVAGWGQTGYNDPRSTTLRWVNVPVTSNTKCGNNRHYGALGKTIWDTNICAGRDRGGIDSCKGDSGGPLFLEIAGQGVVIGVTSWGAGCGNAYAPGVYTRVSMYRDWIYQYVPEIRDHSYYSTAYNGKEPATAAKAQPTGRPTRRTPEPTRFPTSIPTARPTIQLTQRPTPFPTQQPTNRPTLPNPTPRPTPAFSPVVSPWLTKLTPKPTLEPTTQQPTQEPTMIPTSKPTPEPSSRPTSRPTPLPEANTFRPTPDPTTSRPTPAPTNSIPGGSCESSCGQLGSDKKCFCDPSCAASGDCCVDYEVHCAAEMPILSPTELSKAGSCKGKCSEYTGACWCDSLCKHTNDCCTDILAECGYEPIVTSVSYTVDVVATPKEAMMVDEKNSCDGHCGDEAPSLMCYCDKDCTINSDCCADVDSVCPHIFSGAAGKPTAPAAAPTTKPIMKSTTLLVQQQALQQARAEITKDPLPVAAGTSDVQVAVVSMPKSSKLPASINPAESCSGRCASGDSPSGLCFCDVDCSFNSDCCNDYDAACGPNALTFSRVTPVAFVVPEPVAPAITSAVVGGASSCVGKCTSGQTGPCYCDPSCVLNDDCCGDYVSACGQIEPPVTKKAPLFSLPSSERTVDTLRSCLASCDGVGKGPPSAPLCYCDPSCHSSGDCCSDVTLHCEKSEASSGDKSKVSSGTSAMPVASNSDGQPSSAKGSCMGKCGGDGEGCFCDKHCHLNKDCCGDFKALCPSLVTSGQISIRSGGSDMSYTTGEPSMALQSPARPASSGSKASASVFSTCHGRCGAGSLRSASDLFIACACQPFACALGRDCCPDFYEKCIVIG